MNDFKTNTRDNFADASAKTLTAIVEPGAFRIGESQRMELKAYLGVCVGVAVWDRKAKIGGLYHILLPKPSSESSISDPKIYASTGLPLFIKALEGMGASKNNMEAAVAGGALVGELSIDDLQYDIGGRTSDIVRSVLRSEGISVVQSETGGYFSCRMRLDLRDMRCSIDPVGETDFEGEMQSSLLQKADIDSAIDRTRPIPQTALKIIRLIYSKDYNMSEIAREVREDQIIGAKVIRLSNSALNSPARKIDSIDQALVMLGEKMILQLVVSSSVELFYNRSARGYSLCKGGLYHHALGTARVAENLAEFTGAAAPDVAYTAGLLHDIGKVVLDQSMAHIHPLFYRRLYTEKTELIRAERELLGISHTDAGKRLSEAWELPENLQETIAFHHEPERAGGASQLTHLIHIADLLTSGFNAGEVIENGWVGKIRRRMDKLDLSPRRFNELLDQIPWKNLCIPLAG